MNCKETIRSLSAYHDNELEESRKKEIEEHLRGCDSCRRELNEIAIIKLDISSIGNVDPKKNFTAEVMSMVKEYNEKKMPGKLTYVYAFVFTLFFVLGIMLDSLPAGNDTGKSVETRFAKVMLDGQIFISDGHQNYALNQLAGGNDEKRIN
jgi:hypothetical protein